jgi:putative ABC transport system permease protein
VGLGSAIGVFAVINATLINGLPYPEAGRLVVLSTETHQLFSRPAFRRLTVTPGGLELPSAAEARFLTLTSAGMPERIWAHFISPGMVTLLGLTTTNSPAIGRLFDSDQTRGENEVVLTHRAWINRYGGSPSVIGMSVTLDGVTRQVVGVLNPRIDLFAESDFLLPLNLDGPFAYDDLRRTLQVFGRLPAGEDAIDMEFRLGQFFRVLPQSPRGHVEFVQDRAVHGFRAALMTMWLAALMVLLVCCLNFACQLSTRFWSLRNEFVLRARLGATEGRLLRQLLAEGLLISTAGGILGVLLAWLAREVFVKALTNDAVSSAAVTFDWKVITVVGLACGGIGVLFTLTTARQVSSRSVLPAGGSPTMPRRRMVSVIQVVASMVLIGTSGALIQSLSRLQSFDVGYDVDNVVTVRFDLPPDTYGTRTAPAEFVERLSPAVAAIPAVQRVSAASALPDSTTSRQFTFFTLEQEPAHLVDESEPVPLGMPPMPPPPPPPPDAPASERWAHFHRALSFVTSPGFFGAMGVPVLQGRDFTASEQPVRRTSRNRQRSVRAAVFSGWQPVVEAVCDSRLERTG